MEILHVHDDDDDDAFHTT